MKRLLLVVVLIAMSACLLAQITPYGSARVGYWLENWDEDRTGYGESDLRSNYLLQSNSRFGVDFKQEGFDAKVEFGAAPSLRLLWARQSFGNWSLLVGQEEVIPNQKTNQVYNSDGNLIGWGAVDGGRRTQIKFAMDNGLYAALIQPNMVNPAGAPGTAEFLIPMVNVGFNYRRDAISLAPTFVFQTFEYDEYKNGGREGSVMSWLGAVTFDYNANPILVRASFNYGSNTGNMGYTGPNNFAGWKVERDEDDNITNEETVDTATLGGWLTFQYNISPIFNMTAGFGYAASSNDDWDNDDDRMAIYLQAQYRAGRLRIIPEIGLMDEMNNTRGDSQGSIMYFGTQLRLDF